MLYSCATEVNPKRCQGFFESHFGKMAEDRHKHLCFRLGLDPTQPTAPVNNCLQKGVRNLQCLCGAHSGHCCQAAGRTAGRSVLAPFDVFLCSFPLSLGTMPSGWALFDQAPPKCRIPAVLEILCASRAWTGNECPVELEGPAGLPAPNTFGKEQGEPLSVHGPRCCHSCSA